MGMPIPDDMDGKVLTEAFVADYFAEKPITYAEAKASTRKTLELSAEEEEEIKEQLRGLGYMA
jgi:hypothetical protein